MDGLINNHGRALIIGVGKTGEKKAFSFDLIRAGSGLSEAKPDRIYPHDELVPFEDLSFREIVDFTRALSNKYHLLLTLRDLYNPEYQDRDTTVHLMRAAERCLAPEVSADLAIDYAQRYGIPGVEKCNQGLMTTNLEIARQAGLSKFAAFIETLLSGESAKTI